MLWTAYVNEGTVPRGEAFLRAVEALGRRAGVDLTPIEGPVRRYPRGELLERLLELCQAELAGERGTSAWASLERRGFPAETIRRRSPTQSSLTAQRSSA
jgi:hypothetical protein